MRYPFVTITGPSGCGKTTVVRALQECGWVEAVSSTTREPRPGEEEGHAYFFRTVSEFQNISDAGGFLETVEFSGRLYGIESEEIESKVSIACTLLIADGEGVKQIRDRYDGPLFHVYLNASQEVLRDRMAMRGDTVEMIESRLLHDVKFDVWRNEIPWDLLVDNDELERTISLIRSMVGD
jgi:guanylate kinase